MSENKISKDIRNNTLAQAIVELEIWKDHKRSISIVVLKYFIPYFGLILLVALTFLIASIFFPELNDESNYDSNNILFYFIIFLMFLPGVFASYFIRKIILKKQSKIIILSSRQIKVISPTTRETDFHINLNDIEDLQLIKHSQDGLFRIAKVKGVRTTYRFEIPPVAEENPSELVDFIGALREVLPPKQEIKSPPSLREFEGEAVFIESKLPQNFKLFLVFGFIGVGLFISQLIFNWVEKGWGTLCNFVCMPVSLLLFGFTFYRKRKPETIIITSSRIMIKTYSGQEVKFDFSEIERLEIQQDSDGVHAIIKTDSKNNYPLFYQSAYDDSDRILELIINNGNIPIAEKVNPAG